MSRKLLWIVFLLVGALTSPVLAQQEAGDSEFQFQGTLSLSKDDDVPDRGGASVTYGRFLTLRQEVGGTVYAELDSKGDFQGIGGPFYRFNFSTGKIVPYVGAEATAAFGDFVGDSDLLLALEGGFRYFVTRNTAFSVQGVTYHDGDEEEFGDQLTVVVGFSHLWGR